MDIFVARQPIFDRNREVVAYELLFRSSARNEFGQHDTTTASLQMVDTTLLGFGLDSLLGERPGFFNASRKLLVEEHWRVLPPGRSVIEVLETVDPDPDVVQACANARSAGYRVALDDFVFRPEYEPLVAHADYIKVDFLLTQGEERAELAKRFSRRGIRMLAEKVETYDDFRQGLDAGYELFQGYFFCKPEVLSGKDISAVKTSLARLLSEVNRPDLDFDALEELIHHEVALSVKLLRYLRSAGFGWQRDVQSIGQALRILGEKATRKWASLATLTMIGDDKPQELVTTSLLRAQFCEEVGVKAAGSNRRSELFLVGLLSTLDALLDKPLPELLGQMSLSHEVTDALLGGETVLGDCLEMVIAYDHGDWDKVDTIAAKTGIAKQDLPGAYHRSVEWVGAIFTG